MINYPTIDPVMLQIGIVRVHWYGMMYLFGFVAAWVLGRYRASQRAWSASLIDDIIFYCAIGVIVGGRLGYMLFYDMAHLIHAPWSLFSIWQGGMSFHGGLLGVLLALYWMGRVSDKGFFALSDFIAPFVPIGLGAGRIGNFINGELWGRVTDVPWAMAFPMGGPWPRHPSQLYEFFLEGVALFVILWCYSSKPRPKYAVSGLFLLLYGCFRIFCEFFRQPDVQLGFIALDWMTMGQLLSVPMVLCGALLFVVSGRNKFSHTQA